MPPETTERRQNRNFDHITNLHTPQVPDKIPCPRCQSTTTKFCYYNNYNMSQPRYFCKSCRRYWTQGGTLRNVPIGGGNRKNSKRSRTSSPASSSCSSLITHDPKFQAVPMSVSASGSLCKSDSMIGTNGVQSCDADNDGSCGFSALLQSRGPGFLALGGYGYGNPVGTGFEEMGYGVNMNRGVGVGFWAFPDVSNGGSGGETSVVSSRRNGIYPVVSGVNVVDGGSWADVDSYGWPDLAISMPGHGFK